MNQLKWKEINIVIPICRNDGAAITVEDFQDLEAKGFALFGAFTLHPSLHGVWVNLLGVRYTDKIIVMQVLAKDRPDLATRINTIGRFVCERFEQEETLILIRDVHCCFHSNRQSEPLWKEIGGWNGKIAQV